VLPDINACIEVEMQILERELQTRKGKATTKAAADPSLRSG
jgi:hypothetical protein